MKLRDEIRKLAESWRDNKEYNGDEDWGYRLAQSVRNSHADALLKLLEKKKP